jgi:type II secretory pathway predicted ATPase ExeA
MIPQDVVMYEQVFNFNSRPFTAAPYVKHYFAGEAIQSALEQTRLNVDRGAGPVVVVGATGTGKTLLLAVLEANYRDHVSVVNLACARLQERKDLLQSILHQLSVPFQGLSETELRFALIDYLQPNPTCVSGIILLVDDAHGLSAGLLDELGLITNYVSEGQPRVRLILAGSHRLEENLNEAKLESLNQRIASRCYLENMSRSEASRYLVEHVDRVGGEGAKLFPEEACRIIHEVTDGYPRLINQVADHSLMLAATRGMSAITEDCVREAWAVVQSIPATFQPQMPTMSEPSDLSGNESWSVLEFGQLDGGDDNEAGVSIFPTETEASSVQNAPAECLETVYESFQEGSEGSDGDVLSVNADIGDGLNGIGRDNLEQQQAQVLGQVDRKRREICETEGFSEGLGLQQEKAESCEVPSEPSELDASERGNGSSTMEELIQNQKGIDPFQESFAEEEALGDNFTPMVARQNQESLSIRAVDLAGLTPQDLQEGKPSVREAAAASVDARNQDASREVSALPEVSNGSNFMMGTDWTITPKSSAQIDPKLEEAIGNGVPIHGDYVVSRDARKQAEEILGRLDSVESTLKDEVSMAASQEDVSEISAIESKAGPDSEAKDLNLLNVAWVESQQMRNEILEQRNALAQKGKPNVCKLSVEEQSQVNQLHALVKDGRNETPIIVVNCPEDAVKGKPPGLELPAAPTVPASTGKAERMDYQKLFKQLRDIPSS